jgi:hypothetical protein
VNDLLERAAGPPWLVADPAEFARDFDRRSFTFEHKLAQHELFAPERLIALAREMARDPRDVYYDAGDVRVDQRWDQTPICDLPIDYLLERIETAGAWIVLRRAERDPDYARLLDDCMDEIERLAGRDLRKAIKLRNAIVFLNSPNRVSSYHIDRECNWLLQIRGHKTLSVFDRFDREVLPEEELERFWTVDNNAALYKPEFETRAAKFALRPGLGAHIPVNAPHWVQNGPEVSVSLSLNFHYRDGVLADAYRANYWLRRIGLKPAPPERAAVAAKLKSLAYGAARRARATAATFGRKRP